MKYVFTYVLINIKLYKYLQLVLMCAQSFVQMQKYMCSDLNL